MMTERKRKFADAYFRLCNATQAAKEAGYSDHTASQAGYRALRDADVIKLLNSKVIDKEIHVHTTYNNLRITMAVAMEEVGKARKLGIASHLNKTIETALRSIIAVGNAEGLFIHKHEFTGKDGAPLPASQTNILVSVDMAKVLGSLTHDELAGASKLALALAGDPGLASPHDGNGSK